MRWQITRAQITMIHYRCFSWMVFKSARLLLDVSEPLKLSGSGPAAADSQLFNRKFNNSLRSLMNSRNKICTLCKSGMMAAMLFSCSRHEACSPTAEPDHSSSHVFLMFSCIRSLDLHACFHRYASKRLSRLLASCLSLRLLRRRRRRHGGVRSINQVMPLSWCLTPRFPRLSLKAPVSIPPIKI